MARGKKKKKKKAEEEAKEPVVEEEEDWDAPTVTAPDARLVAARQLPVGTDDRHGNIITTMWKYNRR